MTTEDKQKQLAEQCRAVAHMARCIADVHSDLAKINAHPETKHGETFLDLVGQWTHERMELLGDMLNGMDAVTEDDEWIAPIFDNARRLFPLSAHPSTKED